MRPSLFLDYILRLFPVLNSIIEKINGKRNGTLTYLHKDTNILRRVYAPDNKWEADTIDHAFVAADYVAVDSPVPLKKREAISVANGKLPKIAAGRSLKESEIEALHVMEVSGGQSTEIFRRLTQDSVFCNTAIDERNEYAFLYGLSNGYVAVKDDDNPSNLMRLQFLYPTENQFGVASVSEGLTVDDLKNVIDKADQAGNSITKFWIAKSAYDNLRKTQGAKEMAATYQGRVFTADDKLPVPGSTLFNDAFADDNNGITFQVVDRTVLLEQNGKRKPVKPWNKDMVIGVCSDMIGALVYGHLAESTHPVEGVTYQTIEDYKLISQYSETNPLRETTFGQAYALPVIENVDQVYQIDVTSGESVDEDAESEDTEDTYVTISGSKYVKSEAIVALNALGAGLATTATDEEVIAAYNALSARAKTAFANAVSAVEEETTEEDTTE